MEISGKTKVCALIGTPIEHSLSPCIHNAAFQRLNLEFVYVAFRVEPEEVKTAIRGVRSLNIHGLNVTMPHKLAVIRYLDKLDKSARMVGAVNTILNDKGVLIGHNTDGEGALTALEANKENPSGKKIVVLGAGGASKAVSHSLGDVAKEVVILNRTLRKAEDLVRALSSKFGERTTFRFGKLCRSRMEKELKDADLLINATSLGMRPNEKETPVDKELLRPELSVFDLVYDPVETRLIKEAKSVGAKTIEGLTMLIYQGATAFEIWTGEKAPIEVMTEAAQTKLGS